MNPITVFYVGLGILIGALLPAPGSAKAGVTVMVLGLLTAFAHAFRAQMNGRKWRP